MKRIKSCNLNPQRMKERSGRVSLISPIGFFAALTITSHAGQETAGAGGKQP
ncbi:hypothetical protein [Nitrosospira sp. Nsp1]|uniref:hypothetical protein n=1 Tax=Nitrosospira sp. Nsp1 TaxID=136547 RepID=UPI00088FE312|nr:hypothetical protein [Nitrosospira sp. Nsp1]SCX37353.1 hypothetical protein SAMN05720354_10173 [Nitrosospira sp. Nsp1]